MMSDEWTHIRDAKPEDGSPCWVSDGNGVWLGTWSKISNLFYDFDITEPSAYYDCPWWILIERPDPPEADDE
jgi:hypothetical protein